MADLSESEKEGLEELMQEAINAMFMGSFQTKNYERIVFSTHIRFIIKIRSSNHP